ncbi:hypothetical protein BKA58DRAFT_386966 [Alternaria rosae]|uniref:uncharacterized protein n=1 Tax=Alternaria rosae TaxID=1187941 RepID=UPI001E8D8293|nr:uncharacterized protein BKA58DRAFT_386966 [Alternaria rosae]KAH6868481.1 hypothetical protein BKA58DRAFT_386966 [Alternaria rosae]
MDTGRSQAENNRLANCCAAYGYDELMKSRAKPLRMFEEETASQRSSSDLSSHDVSAARPENVEGNELKPLVGRNLNSRTPMWQHDNGCIRTPARFLRWLPGALLNMVESLVSAIANMMNAVFECMPYPFRIVIWFCLLATLTVNGIFLGIALSRRESAFVSFVVEAASISVWAVLNRSVMGRSFSQDRGEVV